MSVQIRIASAARPKQLRSTPRAGTCIASSFYDAAVSGADAVAERPGFAALLAYCETSGIGVVLVENASRFARDLAVQLTGHALLRGSAVSS